MRSHFDAFRHTWFGSANKRSCIAGEFVLLLLCDNILKFFVLILVLNKKYLKLAVDSILCRPCNMAAAVLQGRQRMLRSPPGKIR